LYEPLGAGRYRSTPATQGPWDPGAQHAGPPSALIGGLLQVTGARPDAQVVRVTVEILGPVPVAELTATTRVSRPGRSVELVEGSLSAGGREVVRAAAWRMRTASLELPPHPAPATPGPPPLPGPETRLTPPPSWQGGYLDHVEWRFARGSFGTPGPSTVWTRLGVDVVAGAEPSPLERALAVADCGNGVSGVLPIEGWLFINCELTVHLHRLPEGPWVCLDAETTIEPDGVGLAASVLSDERGPVGRGAQALLVGTR
jgi:hypothetical protein